MTQMHNTNSSDITAQCFQLLQTMCEIGHWHVDVHLNRLFWSNAVFRIHGVTPEEYTPELSTAIAFYHPEDQPLVSQYIEQAIKTGLSFEFSLRILRPNGDLRYVKTKSQCTYDANGDLQLILGVFQDITETKPDISALRIAERTIQENLDFQKLLMNTNTDLFFVKDEQFRIVEANTAFLNLYPADIRDKVIGSTTIEAYTDSDVELFLAEDKQAFAEGISEVVETILFPDGFERVLLTKKIRFVNSQNKAFILCVARDITDLKKTEQQLLLANQELEEFAYRTSHDLRSPLVSSGKLLEMSCDALQKNDYTNLLPHITLVRNNVKKLEALVTDILKLGQITHEELPYSPIDADGAISACLDKLSSLEGYDNIKFETTTMQASHALIIQDIFILVLENLISNAIKYHDPAKYNSHENPCYIKISMQIIKQKMMIEVSDNGLGIPAHNHETLFEMFKRFHPKTSFGSGLGLYMIKKSVEKINGSIQYQPLEDGSKFIVVLPCKNAGDAQL